MNSKRESGFFSFFFSPSLLFPTHPPDVVQLALVGDFPAAGLGDLEDCFFFFLWRSSWVVFPFCQLSPLVLTVFLWLDVSRKKKKKAPKEKKFCPTKQLRHLQALVSFPATTQMRLSTTLHAPRLADSLPKL